MQEVNRCCFKGVSVANAGIACIALHAYSYSSICLYALGKRLNILQTHVLTFNWYGLWMYLWQQMCTLWSHCAVWGTQQLRGVWAKSYSSTSIFCLRFWFHPVFAVRLKLPCMSSACVRLSVLFPHVFGTANGWLPLWDCFLAYHCAYVLYVAWARPVRRDHYWKLNALSSIW